MPYQVNIKVLRQWFFTIALARGPRKAVHKFFLMQSLKYIWTPKQKCNVMFITAYSPDTWYGFETFFPLFPSVVSEKSFQGEKDHFLNHMYGGTELSL